MIKYFIDTEFIEGFHRPMFGKRRHHIDLISIGIYCEDGRTFYAISSEYDYSDASQWVKDNVIAQAYKQSVHGDRRNHYKVSNFHREFGVPNREIARRIQQFVAFNPFPHPVDPQFYGYYADYDWVLFCSLFGTMMNLPKGYPMYCIDLKQMMVERGLTKEWKQQHCPDPTDEHHALADAKWNHKLFTKITETKSTIR